MLCRALGGSRSKGRNGGMRVTENDMLLLLTVQMRVLCSALVQRRDFVPEHVLYLQRQRGKCITGNVGLSSNTRSNAVALISMRQKPLAVRGVVEARQGICYCVFTRADITCGYTKIVQR